MVALNLAQRTKPLKLLVIYVHDWTGTPFFSTVIQLYPFGLHYPVVLV